MTIYLRAGYLTQEFYWFVAGLLVIAFVGSYIGKLLLNKIPQSSFRKRMTVPILYFIANHRGENSKTPVPTFTPTQSASGILSQ